MFWQDENTEPERFAVPDDVVDLAFGIQCRALPVDHAWALSEAVLGVLPWIAAEEGAGVHAIHVAESGNGWMRPGRADDLLYLSRRTPLVLRLPKHRIEDARRLTGATLNVAGNEMRVGAAAARPLSAAPTIFSRYVLSEESDEAAFMRAAATRLKEMGIEPRKMLCGMERVIATPERALRTRSLMLADLPPAESVRLQQRGLGSGRSLGCGLFVAHKDLREVGAP